MDQLLGFLLVLDNQGVQVSSSSDLEFGLGRVLLDGGRLDVSSSSELEEKLDVLNFFLVRKMFVEYY
jgi:hypothetical protein